VLSPEAESVATKEVEVTCEGELPTTVSMFTLVGGVESMPVSRAPMAIGVETTGLPPPLSSST